MLDAKVPDISLELDKTIQKVHDRLFSLEQVV